MKKSFIQYFIFLIIAVAFLSGCNKDNTTPVEPAYPRPTGSWTVKKYEADPDFLGVPERTEYTYKEKDITVFIMDKMDIFNKDPRVVYRNPYLLIWKTVSIQNSSCCCDQNYIQEFILPDEYCYIRVGIYKDGRFKDLDEFCVRDFIIDYNLTSASTTDYMIYFKVPERVQNDVIWALTGGCEVRLASAELDFDFTLPVIKR